MAKVAASISKLAKQIQALDRHPRFRDLVVRKHVVLFPEITHELYSRLYVVWVQAYSQLYNPDHSVNHLSIDALKQLTQLDIQIIGVRHPKICLVFSKGKFTL